jgi:hypothetical protein
VDRNKQLRLVVINKKVAMDFDDKFGNLMVVKEVGSRPCSRRVDYSCRPAST